MVDPWDFDSRHPANGRTAEFGHKTFVAQLEDCHGETLTFLGSVDYKVDELGMSIVRFDYWPHLPSMRDSIENYIMTEVVR